MNLKNEQSRQGELTPSFLLIGSGRLARHFQFYFSQLGIPFTTWNRHQTESELQNALASKPTVLLAISDQALSGFYSQYLKALHIKTVHFSGALHLEGTFCCHPLMTFGPDLYDLETYCSIHFAVTGVEDVQDVLPFLQNPSFQLRSEDKALYHALCVLSAAGAQSLWSQASRSFEKLGLPSEALKPYVKQIGLNFAKSGSAALTGPWVRQDFLTIEKNLKALEEFSPDLNIAYSTLKGGLYDNP
jgi:hypothetical protein